MHNVIDADWDTWNRQMRRVLIESQDREGCATGSWDPEQPAADIWGAQGGRLMTTSFNALTLEVYYRYLPLFRTDSLVPGKSAHMDSPNRSKRRTRSDSGHRSAGVMRRYCSRLSRLSMTGTQDRRKNASEGASESGAAAQHAAAPRTAFGTQPRTPLDLARFLIILAAAHLLLDPAALHQLAEAPHRLLNRLPLTQCQFDHSFLLRVVRYQQQKTCSPGHFSPSNGAAL